MYVVNMVKSDMFWLDSGFEFWPLKGFDCVSSNRGLFYNDI